MKKMNKETKEEVLKNSVTGASSAVGAAAGVAAGAAIFTPGEADAHDEVPTEAELQEMAADQTEPLQPEPQPAPAPQPQPAPAPQPQTVTPQPEPTPAPEPNPAQRPTAHEPAMQPDPNVDPALEVIDYARVADDTGNVVDIAVVEVNGQEMGIVDFDLDGEADALMIDINENGIIEEDEVMDIQGQGIAMQPFQEAAGFEGDIIFPDGVAPEDDLMA